MEQLIREIEAFAKASGRTPQSVLRSAVGANWGTWGSWLSRKSTPTYAVGERVHAYMAANPPAAAPEQDVA